MCLLKLNILYRAVVTAYIIVELLWGTPLQFLFKETTILQAPRDDGKSLLGKNNELGIAP